jgi:4-hydroxymandelate oxidase
MSARILTRRDLFTDAGTPLLQAQNAARNQPRVPPLGELVNVPEFEEAARIKLDPALYATVAGGDRDAFDRITLRPRMFVDSAPLNLTTELFGEKMFAPILVGPIGQQRQFHPEGELATVQGASAAKATVVISSRSSHPIEEIAARSKTTMWYQVYLDRDLNGVRSQIERSIQAGCRAICLTIGTPPTAHSSQTAAPRPNWRAIEELRARLDVPVLLKGVMTSADAQGAVDRGIKGIIVSSGGLSGARPAPIEALASVVDAVGSRVPVLVDGSFRRGTDVIKALAFGARAVLLGRPPMWGLAGYGSEGVQAILKLLQTELARTMVNVGKPTIDMLDRTLVKVHGRAST